MKKVILYIANRCKEPSSFAGFAAQITAIVATDMPPWAKAVVFTCGLYAFLMEEKG
jgi:hypothetical protein